MKIAIASPPYPTSIEDGLYWVDKLSQQAGEQGAKIICFPESYIPGYPLPEKERMTSTPAELREALEQVCHIATAQSIAIIIAMDWYEGDRFLNVAQVITAEGKVLGFQTKNQLDPSEDNIWAAGKGRKIFAIDGLQFGISICHEGFRYPETVRWAARQGAHIVFHPHFAGSDVDGKLPTQFGSMNNPYYEKAMMMRALENTIYFASSNYATTFPESASALISPDGTMLIHQEYGKPGVFVYDIDLSLATGFLAKRLKTI